MTMTPDNSTKEAALKLLMAGMVTKAEAAALAGVSPQVMNYWSHGLRPQSARAAYLKSAWNEALLSIKKKEPTRPAGLRADLEIWTHETDFRCGKCDIMQEPGALRVWVRRNGSIGAWCVGCAQKLKGRRK